MHQVYIVELELVENSSLRHKTLTTTEEEELELVKRAELQGFVGA